MKKKSMTFCTAMICLFCACKPHGNGHPVNSTDSYSVFIPADTANKMLGSYLSSINYSQNDSDLQSLTVDAGQLRTYLAAGSVSDPVTSIKLMFAHTLPFSNSSKSGTNAGYRSGALTIIIAAVKANGNYVYYDGNKVLDYTAPCPPKCLTGQAASPLFPLVKPKR